MGNTSTASVITALTSLLTSVSLVISDAMHWLNGNAGAIGAICAILTLLLTWRRFRKDSDKKNKQHVVDFKKGLL